MTGYTVRDISLDDRARIATCSLRTPTDKCKENYSIDRQLPVRVVVSDVAVLRLVNNKYVV